MNEGREIADSQIGGGATVVVGDPALADELRRARRGPIIAVEHYLDALGDSLLVAI